MQITELIEELERVKMSHGDEVEVRLSLQPSYPFEHEIAGVSEPLTPFHFDDDDRPAESRDSDSPLEKTVIYIAEGSQIGYLPGKCAEELEYVW